MRHVISGGLVAAALGTALIVAGAFPAAAQVARVQPAFATGSEANPDLILVQRGDRGDRGGRSGGRAERGGGNDRAAARGNRSGGRYGIPVTRANSKYTQGNRGDGRGWNNGRRYSGNNWRWRHRYGYRYRGYPYWGSGFAFGLAASAPYYAAAPRYYVGDDAVAYCMSRFRSYDPGSGTYLGYDGLRHPCP